MFFPPKVVLNCVLKKDIQYTKANPKFHHWNTDEKRFGLTFERSDDAKAFDHGIRHAVADLSEGTVCGFLKKKICDHLFLLI